MVLNRKIIDGEVHLSIQPPPKQLHTSFCMLCFLMKSRSLVLYQTAISQSRLHLLVRFGIA